MRSSHRSCFMQLLLQLNANQVYCLRGGPSYALWKNSPPLLKCPNSQCIGLPSVLAKFSSLSWSISSPTSIHFHLPRGPYKYFLLMIRGHSLEQHANNCWYERHLGAHHGPAEQLWFRIFFLFYIFSEGTGVETKSQRQNICHTLSW